MTLFYALQKTATDAYLLEHLVILMARGKTLSVLEEVAWFPVISKEIPVDRLRVAAQNDNLFDGETTIKNLTFFKNQ